MSTKHSTSMHFGALKNKNMFKMAHAGLLSHTPPNKWAWCMLTMSGLNSLNIYLNNSVCIYCSYIHRYIITFWCLFEKTVKYRRSQDQEDGSEGKDTCPQAWVPSLDLWDHIKVEGVRWIHKTVFWPLHKCHGLHSDTVIMTTNNSSNGSSKWWCFSNNKRSYYIHILSYTPSIMLQHRTSHPTGPCTVPWNALCLPR